MIFGSRLLVSSSVGINIVYRRSRIARCVDTARYLFADSTRPRRRHVLVDGEYYVYLSVNFYYSTNQDTNLSSEKF